GGENEVELGEATQRGDDPEVRPAGGDGKSEFVGVGSVDHENETDTGLGSNEPQEIDADEATDRLNEGTEAERRQQADAAAVRRVRVAIMERYARTQGFRKENDRRFSHKDGGWIVRANGARFPWEHYGADGGLVRHYLPREHCLEREPLQIEADVWRLMETRPEIYALILADISGAPTEVTGSRLKAMQAEGQVVLFPATYRLVFDESGVG
ncbi:MAG: ATPase, partial [Gemmatimonadetes bacterium]|nr:ATPase [Gemmatimonadota bacterium]